MRVVLLAAVTLLGCASLQLQSTDSVGAKTGKVAARVPLALVTLGISEIAIKRNARDLAQENLDARYRTLLFDLDRYKRLADEATTDAERARANQLHDATLDEIRTLYRVRCATDCK